MYSSDVSHFFIQKNYSIDTVFVKSNKIDTAYKDKTCYMNWALIMKNHGKMKSKYMQYVK